MSQSQPSSHSQCQMHQDNLVLSIGTPARQQLLGKDHIMMVAARSKDTKLSLGMFPMLTGEWPMTTLSRTPHTQFTICCRDVSTNLGFGPRMQLASANHHHLPLTSR